MFLTALVPSRPPSTVQRLQEEGHSLILKFVLTFKLSNKFIMSYYVLGAMVGPRVLESTAIKNMDNIATLTFDLVGDKQRLRK